MDFQPYRALIGSRLKFWTVPQGLKIHGPWPSSGILDCLRGSPDRRPLEPGSMEWLIKRSFQSAGPRGDSEEPRSSEQVLTEN